MQHLKDQNPQKKFKSNISNVKWSKTILVRQMLMSLLLSLLLSLFNFSQLIFHCSLSKQSKIINKCKMSKRKKSQKCENCENYLKCQIY